MFGKDKVKGHSRLSKGKSGFKVIRVKDFFRKKDEDSNRNRNIALGTAAVIGVGGVALLLSKKKPSLLIPKSSKSGNPIKVINETIGTPPKQKSMSGKEFIQQMDDEWGVGKKKLNKTTTLIKEVDAVIPVKTPKLVEVKDSRINDMPELKDFWNTKNTPGTRMLEKGDRVLKVSKRASGIRKKTGFSKVSDPWETPLKSNLKKEPTELLVKKEGIKLLSPAKVKPRKNLLVPSKKDKVTSSVINMRNTQRDYDSLDIPMKATIQMEKALTRPIRESLLGRPPDTKGLKAILDTGNKADVEQVITKASRKVNDRLVRQNDLLKKNKLDDIVPSPSKRALLKKVIPKVNKDKALTMLGDVVEPKAPMGKIIRQMNSLAKNSELEELNITVRDDEWQKALATITGRREMMSRTKNGLSSATESLVYSRVVKPKVIKTLMGQIKSGNLQTTNPKGYTQRLQRIQENLSDLYKKEGIDYKKVSRRESAKRTAKIMQPEIDDTIVKAKDFATDGKALLDMLRPNPELEAGLDRAGIKDPKMRTVIRLISHISGK